MPASSLLDRLTFTSESDSDSDSEFPETGSEMDSDSYLESDSEILEPDPKPKRRGKMTAASAPKVTAAVKKQVRETLNDLVDLPISLWELRDPHCAGAARNQQEEIVNAFLAFVIKRPTWVAGLTGLDESLDVVRLIRAVYPVVMAILAHHIAKTVGQEEEDVDLSGFAAPRIR